MSSGIVVGFDGTAAGERALLAAGREAAWRGADITVIHAYRPAPWTTEADIPAHLARTRWDAAYRVAALGAGLLHHLHPDLHVTAEAPAGAAHDVLVAAARSAYLLVLGARGAGGFASLSLGSVPMRTLVRTSCPTMVVRGTDREPRGVIAVGVDIEDPAEEALDFAFAEARLRSAELDAVSACDVTRINTYLGDGAATRDICDRVVQATGTAAERIMKAWTDRFPTVRVQQDIVDDTPAGALVEAASDADVVVVGAHRDAGEGRGVRLGPAAQALLRHAACPVIVVPLAVSAVPVTTRVLVVAADTSQEHQAR